MDQVKIGKFIAKCRKEKKLTQQELSEKLGVTDKAISKWENGRGMPDISLLQQLIEILDISLNELLAGEKIRKKSTKIYDENLMKSLTEKNNLSKKMKRITITFSIIIIILFISITIISIKQDNNKNLKNNYQNIIRIYSNISSNIITNLYDITEEKNELQVADESIILGFGNKLKDFDTEDVEYKENLNLLTNYIHECYYEELDISKKLKENKYDKLQDKRNYILKSNITRKELEKINGSINKSICLKKIESLKKRKISNNEVKRENFEFMIENISSYTNSTLYKKKNKTFNEIVISDMITLFLVYDLSTYLRDEYLLITTPNQEPKLYYTNQKILDNE